MCDSCDSHRRNERPHPLVEMVHHLEMLFWNTLALIAMLVLAWACFVFAFGG